MNIVNAIGCIILAGIITGVAFFSERFLALPLRTKLIISAGFVVYVATWATLSHTIGAP